MRAGRHLAACATLPPVLTHVPHPRWLVLQLADSAFPTGGFAHSAGLEAAVQLGLVRTVDDLDTYCRWHLWNTGHAALPFVGAAHDAPAEVWELDTIVDAMLSNHVANRASRTQGRALLATCARVFDSMAVTNLARRGRERGVFSHVAPMFGALMASLAIDRRETLALYLYTSARGVAAAGVRLGVVGPYEAQRLQQRNGGLMDDVVTRCETLGPREATTVVPLFDVAGATQDRLYARLFQS